MRFIHAADIHLGFEQYHLNARYNDFGKAYLDVVHYAVEREVDFVLLAGDLFHKANTDAYTMRQATYGLSILRDARIPVLAVEGNHDTQQYKKHMSWMEFLNEQGLLCLLDAARENGLYSLPEFDPVARRGSYVDIGGARIYGLRYYGAATARVLEQVQEELEPHGFTILMLHAGMEGQVPHMHGGLTHAQVAPLHPPVDYLALGHIHKRLCGEDGWIWNPGSTEVNSFEEMDWPHGFFDVTVSDGIPRVEAVDLPHRPFYRIAVNADDTESLEEFVAAARQRIAATNGIPVQAVIELSLGGIAAFRRQDVPAEEFKALITERFDPLFVKVRNNLVPPGAISVRHGDRMTRRELEREVITNLIRQNGDYRDYAEKMATLTLDVKELAVGKNLPATIVDEVQAYVRRVAHPAEDVI